MRTFRSLVLAPAVALAVFSTFSVVAGAAYATGNPSVLNDNQASQFAGALADSSEQPNTEVEPSIAVNPADSSNVVTGFQEGRHNGGGDADNGFGASLDSGHHWTYGNLPGNTVFSGNSNFGRGSDAAVAFGKDPRGYKGYAVYINNLVFNDAGGASTASGMSINVSLDGGLTWKPAAFPEADNVQGLNDKNWIVADNGSGTGHHTGRVYNFWDKEAAAIVYSYCDADVANPSVMSSVAGCENSYNWSAFSPVDTCSVLPFGGSNCTSLGGVLTPLTGIGAFPVVLNDGSVGVAFANETAGVCSNPTDQSCGTATTGLSIAWTLIPAAGGVAWPSPLPATMVPVTINTYNGKVITDQRAGGLPQAAVDPTTDNVYVVWEDGRFRTDAAGSANDPVVAVSKPAAPGAEPGLTWSTLIRIDSGAPTDDQVNRYNTTVAVGQDGIARFAYRQRDENQAHGFNPNTGRGSPIDTYYQESRDAGTTFTTPLLVDTVQNTPDAGYGAYDTTNTPFGLFEGDYEQIAAGGPDESYVTRDEAYKGLSTSVARDFASSETPSANEWQHTWVSHLGLEQQVATPDSRFVPGLILAGLAGAAVMLLQRRRARRPLI